MIPAGRLWPTELRASERRLLRGEPLRRAQTRPDVLVVGGGIMGVATAHACAEGGLGEVVLVEAADTLGAGATGGAAGLLVPEAHHGVDPELLVALGRLGLETWRRMHRAVPGGLGVVDMEWLGLVASPAPAPAPAAVPAGTARGAPFARFADHETVARLVPGIAGDWAGVLVRDQARVNPLAAVARLAGRLPHVVTSARVRSVEIAGGVVRHVETSAGRISPGAVVFATGGPPDLDGLELDVPADRVKGHMVCTSTDPAAIGWRGTVDLIGTHLGDGRVLIGGTFDPGDDDPWVRDEVVHEMLGGAAKRLPVLSRATVTCAWTCFRPRHPDGLPVVDRVPGADNAWFTSGHFRTGILTAPATAAILARWVATDERPSLVTSLGCDRFEPNHRHQHADGPGAPEEPSSR